MLKTDVFVIGFKQVEFITLSVVNNMRRSNFDLFATTSEEFTSPAQLDNHRRLGIVHGLTVYIRMVDFEYHIAEYFSSVVFQVALYFHRIFQMLVL